MVVKEFGVYFLLSITLAVFPLLHLHCEQNVSRQTAILQTEGKTVGCVITIIAACSYFTDGKLSCLEAKHFLDIPTAHKW